jgi:hypothetical protein
MKSLTHLETIGLITLAYNPQLSRDDLEIPTHARYFDQHILFNFQTLQGTKIYNNLSCGIAEFTEAGEQLAPLTDAVPVDGFFEYALDYFCRSHTYPSCPWPRA